jgi:hypothetical protein
MRAAPVACAVYVQDVTAVAVYLHF